MEIPHTVTNRPDTGLYNAKVGIWLFLASEVMLFGGLFSAYIFLRTGVEPGVDFPWPNGLDVHGDFVWLGFTNTLVLIASSVFVLMALAQLKLRNFGKYQFYMVLVLACAAGFMCIKAYEYNNKFNHHFGIRMTDNTVLDGELADKTVKAGGQELVVAGDEILFEATEAELALVRVGFWANQVDPYFTDYAQGDDEVVYKVKFLDPSSLEPGTTNFAAGEERDVPAAELQGELTAHLDELEAALKKDTERKRKEAKEAVREADGSDAVRRAKYALNGIRLPKFSAKLSAKLNKPTVYKFKRKDVLGGKYSQDTIPFFSGHSLKGKMVDDDINLIVHSVDFQMVSNDMDSMAWKKGDGGYLDDTYKAGYDHHKHEAVEKYKKWIAAGNYPTDRIYLWKHAHPQLPDGSHGHSEPIAIKAKDSFFMGSHGPKFGPYYAIYFTMTALHGLHVIGGALVLAHFLFFGKKIYLKDPEHLANRVEVGGLFWHFVDLIWIFLFPLFYLL